MQGGPRVRVIAGTVAFLGGACATTALYTGPARPASEVSLLTFRDSHAIRVDRLRLDDTTGPRYALLPGDHEVTVKLDNTLTYVINLQVQPITVCIQLEPGHSYRVEPDIKSTTWSPRVFDVNSREELDASCARTPSPRLRAVPPRAPAPAASPPAAAASPAADLAPSAPEADGVAPAPGGEAAPDAGGPPAAGEDAGEDLPRRHRLGHRAAAGAVISRR